MEKDRFLLIVCDTGADEEAVRPLEEAGATGYTRFSGASGVGETGRHEGSPVWPGQNTLILSAVSESLVPEVVRRLKGLHNSRPGHVLGLKIFAFPVQEFL